VTTVNSYDRAGRVTTRAYYGEPDPGPKTPAVYFFYDGKGLDAPQTPNSQRRVHKQYCKWKSSKLLNTNGFSEYYHLETQ
jgi:hypothetical protein